MKYRENGFTLLELLVAVAIFALIATMSYQAIDNTIMSKTVSEKRLHELSALNHFFSLLKRELMQAVNRPARNQVGDIEAGLLVNDDGDLLEFSHHGRIVHINPVLTTLQRTRYLLKDSQITREQWPVLDRATDTGPVSTILLEGIEDMQIELFETDNSVRTQWPYLDAGTGQSVSHLPVGIRITIESRHYGSVSRTFPLGGA